MSAFSCKLSNDLLYLSVFRLALFSVASVENEL